MYSIVACPETRCHHVWIVEDRPNRTKCPKCETSHQFKKLRKYVKTDTKEEARQKRPLVFGKVNDRMEEVKSAGERGVLDERENMDTVDVDELLEEHGFDSAEVERAGEVSSGSESNSHRDIMRSAFSEHDGAATEDEIIEYATSRGVPEDKVRNVLNKWRQSGKIMFNARTDEYKKI